MLRCPFCDSDLNDVPLRAGRCPTCGGVMAWQDDTADSLPRIAPLSAEKGSRGDQTDAAFPVANGHSAGSESQYDDSAFDAAPPSSVAISKTHEISEPVTIPPKGGAESDPPYGRHATIRLNETGTVDEDEIQKTITPRVLTDHETRTLQKMWRNTYTPATRVNNTIKTQEALPVRPTSRRVPTRDVRDEQEKDSASADYQLLEIIGEGGVGIVYAAQQTSVDRTVALKMLRSENTQDWEQRQKFLSEAVVTGDLDHPNIVPIYELGSGHDGALFYAMKRVSGTPWSDVLLNKSLEENLEILMKVADAIAFAHSRGVVHRDLKPENVMLGGFGEVQVMDWGIALPTPKFHRAADILTTGSLGGTPAYMAPEMATGPIGRIGPASDIYLLGGILYECISGQTPHSGSDVMACLHAAAANEIQPTHKNGELMDIALQAMKTDPADRFESVQEFQSAIRQYQSHTESIALSSRAEDDLRQADGSRDYQDYSRALFAFQEAFALWNGNHRAAMGVTAAKLAYAQCALEKGDFDLGLSLLDESEPTHQRARVKLIAAQKERDARQQRLKAMKRTAALLVVVLFVVVGSGLVIVRSWQKDAEYLKEVAVDEAAKALKAEKEAKIQKGKAEKNETVAKVAAKAAKDSADFAEERRKAAEREKARAEAQQRLAQAAKLREELAKTNVEYETYVAQIALAAEKVSGNAFDGARELLKAYEGNDVRGWEWRRLSYLAKQFKADFPCGDTPVHSVAFSPDGQQFVTGGQDGIVRVWQTLLNPGANPKPVWSKAHTATTGQTVAVNAVAWTEVAIGGERLSLIATVGERGSVILWKADGTQVRRLEGHGSDENVSCARFSVSPQGHQWLVTGSQHAAQQNKAIVWDLTSGRILVPLRGHSGWVWDVAVSRDQQRIATAGEDGKIFIWNATKTNDGGTFPVLKELAGYHDGAVYSIDFSPDGKRVVSAGIDRLALIWNLSDAKTVDLAKRLGADSDAKDRSQGTREAQPNWLVLRGHTAAVRRVRFSPEATGSRILSCGDDNTACLWDAKTGKLERTLRGHGGYVRSAAFAPAAYQLQPAETSDRLVLSGGYDGKAKLWRTAGYGDVRAYGSRIASGHEDEVLAAVYGPKGTLFATASKDRTIRVWDATSTTGKPKFELKEGHDFLSTSVLYFRKGPFAGRRFITSGMDGTVRVWQRDTGTQIAALSNAGSSGAIALSHDETELAAGGAERKLPNGRSEYPILIWNVADLASKTPLQKHNAQVTALAYSPDGKHLISGDADGFCFVWTRTDNSWSEPRSLLSSGGPPHSKRINSIVFLDAGRVATASNDRTLAIWDLATGTGRTIQSPDSVIAMDASPDGSRLVITTSRADEFVSQASGSNGNGRQQKRTIPDSFLQTYSRDGKALETEIIKRATVGSVRFSPDGSRVLAMADEGRIFEWTPGGPARQRTNQASSVMWAATYSPNGKQVLTVGGRRAVLWNWPPAGNTPSEAASFGPHASISQLSFSPDGSKLASADRLGTVKVWNLQTQRAEQTLQVTSAASQKAPAIAALFSPRDNGLLYAVSQTTVRPWRFDAASKSWKGGTSIPIPDRPATATATAAAISSDGTWLIVGMSDGTAIVVSAAGKSLTALNGSNRHLGAIRSVAVSSDRKWIVTGGDDKTAIVWEQTADGQHWDAIAKLSGHPAPVNAVGISGDRFRVLTGSEDKTAKVWDTRRLAKVEIAADPERRKVQLQQLVLVDLKAVQEGLQTRNVAKDVGSNALRKRRIIAGFETLRTLTRPVSGADEIKDVGPAARQLVDKLVAQLNPDKPADAADPTQNWNLAQLRATSLVLKRMVAGPEAITEILTLQGHTNGVTAVSFSPDDNAVLTGSRDGSAIVWPAARVPQKKP